MKSWIFVSLIFSLLTVFSYATVHGEKSKTSAAPKIVDKPTIYPKKVTSLKKRPIKSSSAGKISSLSLTKNTIDAFKNLPTDDLEFIKELDKQFRLHGDNIKIKVKRENVTSTKNTKRTVDGEMGYGQYSSYDQEEYNYPKASFSFYPYSQEDIPSSKSTGNQENYEKTTVTIEPSVSFEIKHLPSDVGGNSYHQEYYDQSNQSPLIVLRIPGSRKYAAHLQSLLQQYLEIKAAQYLKILEEAELQRSHQQQYEPIAQPEHQYYKQPEEAPVDVYQQQQPQPQQPQHQEGISYVNYQQSHDNYPSIADVYHTYKDRYQQQKSPEPPSQQYSEQPVHYLSSAVDHQIQPQYYYLPQHPSAAAAGQSYRNVYLIAMAMPAHQPEQQYSQQHQFIEQSSVHDEAASQPSPLTYAETPSISENSPRPTHTKVVFTATTESSKDYSQAYPLPSSIHTPTTIPIYEKYQQQQQNNEPTQEIDYHQQQQHQSLPEQQQQQQQQQHQQHEEPRSYEEKVVSITQRPFNYHAHSMKNYHRPRNSNKRDASKKVKNQ